MTTTMMNQETDQVDQVEQVDQVGVDMHKRGILKRNKMLRQKLFLKKYLSTY